VQWLKPLGTNSDAASRPAPSILRVRIQQGYAWVAYDIGPTYENRIWSRLVKSERQRRGRGLSRLVVQRSGSSRRASTRWLTALERSMCPGHISRCSGSWQSHQERHARKQADHGAGATSSSRGTLALVAEAVTGPMAGLRPPDSPTPFSGPAGRPRADDRPINAAGTSPSRRGVLQTSYTFDLGPGFGKRQPCAFARPTSSTASRPRPTMQARVGWPIAQPDRAGPSSSVQGQPVSPSGEPVDAPRSPARLDGASPVSAARAVRFAFDPAGREIA
jgi:hypothetical protein